MGYETRLILGKRIEESGEIKYYLSAIASIDLCKVACNNFEKLLSRLTKDSSFTKYPRTYYYEGYCKKCNSEHKIIADSYGDALRLVPAKEVLAAMVADNKIEKYRRFNMAIPLLREAIKGFGKDELFCVLYGY